MAAVAEHILILSAILLLSTGVSALPRHGLDTEFYRELQQLLSLKAEIADAEAAYQRDEEIKRKPEVPQEVPDWPAEALSVGQISGVSVNSQGQPVIFHRGSRVWDEWSFNETNHFQPISDGPVKENTIITLDPNNGKVLHEWGSNMFYMPHGLTLDRHDNTWITDVALHQVFKFPPGEPDAVLTFGVRLQPGAGPRHLCKPTAVAVAATGEVFVADGYCNSRILKYNAAGGLLRIIPNPPEFLSLQVPHGLALMEQWDRICVADRENMRVVCPRVGLYTRLSEPATALTIQEPDLGRVYAVAAKGNLIYAVNGPTSPMIPVRGFTIDPRSETIIDHWTPAENMKNPHAIAISPNGSCMYIAEIGPNKLWKFNLEPQNE